MGQVFLYITELFFQTFSRITSLLLKPIFDFLVDFDLLSYNYLDTAQYFLNNYFYKYIRFAKQVVINITGIPSGLFVLLGVLLGFHLIGFFTMLGVKFIFNAWSLYRSGSSMKGVINTK